MFRARDWIALVLATLLSRMAWNESVETSSADAHLAFYFPRNQAPAVSAMDLDGDGTNEALAIIQKDSEADAGEDWELKILDLKPLHSFGKTHLAPFQPEVLYRTKKLREPNATPIRLTTGHVLLKKNGEEEKISQKDSAPQDFNERSKHYFCGTDWHDAASKCGTPCPSGQGTECPEDERCFADTPCDATELGKAGGADLELTFDLTPGGGYPSIVTLWSNGAVTLHGLVGEMALETKGAEPKKRRRPSAKSMQLQQMWHEWALPQGQQGKPIEWEESSIRFMDAYESDAGPPNKGMIIVGGSFRKETDDETSDDTVVPFVVALDAASGKQLWSSGLDEVKEESPLPLPMQRGASSFARRRSRLSSLQQRSGLLTHIEAGSLPNCLTAFKHSITEALPYSYSSSADAYIMPMHLNHKPGSSRSHPTKGHVKPHGHPHHETNNVHDRRKWHHRFNKKKEKALVLGRPNVLVSHSRGGMRIRSIRNGRSICHLSLMESILYTDINGDGILDQIQVVLHSKQQDNSDPWVWKLVEQVSQEHEDLKRKRAKQKLMDSSPKVCHILALSGLPARETHFSASVCGSPREHASDSSSLDAVSPIVVESLDGRRGTRDVIVAINDGTITRFHGTTGRREWRLQGRQYEAFPTWEAGHSQNALLTRVQGNGIPPSTRPVLLIGENSLAVVSVKNGAMLASVNYPQVCSERPILTEITGDGTTDVIAMSHDAVWGFQVVVVAGSPILMRLLTGLLLMTLMLAVLWHRFGQKQQKRGTDL